ncbi:MAG: DMT family transporter [Promethearchaeota archaeon]
MAKNNDALPKILMMISASLMASVGIFVNLMPISLNAIMEYRGFFGLIWISVLMVALKKQGAVKKLIVLKKDLGLFMAFTVLTILFYFTTIKISGIAVAAFLLYLGPIFSILFIRQVLHEKMPLKGYLSYILGVIGTILILQPWDTLNVSFGFVTGILSAICLGLLTMIKKNIFKKINLIDYLKESLKENDISFGLTWYSALGLSITFSFTFFMENKMFESQVLLAGILLGLIPTALAFTFYNVALQRDVAGNIIIFSYFEPFVASVISALLFGNFSLMVIIGGSLIILGNTNASLLKV